MVDAMGLPVDFEVTVGERHDSQPAPVLIDRVQPRELLADKAYDTNTIREQLAEIGCKATIPPTKQRKAQIPYDKEMYKARSLVECTFSLFKQARRFATRYEKTLRNYTAMVTLCCIRCWLRI
jgi:transposase